MATAALAGDARFEYGAGPTTHLLAVPLKDVRPADPRTRHVWWSADMTTREVTNVGAAVYEIIATIRMDNEPDALKILLWNGLNGKELTYRTTSGGTAFPVLLVEVVGKDGVELDPDRDRYGFGEWEATVRLRRVDGTTLNALL